MEHVKTMLSEKGVPCYNKSVGNATSIMGLMRLFQTIEQISPGDVVLWEYPILDILMSDLYGAAEIMSAYRIAWQRIAKKKAQMIVVNINPRQAILDGRDGELARQIHIDAHTKSLGWVAMRDVMIANRITEPKMQAAHYGGENGHLFSDSPMLAAFSVAVWNEIDRRLGEHFDTFGEGWSLPSWLWYDGPSLRTEHQPDVIEFANTLMSVRALQMKPNNSAYVLPKPARRVVALGLVTTHRSGAVWCGHACCGPASARLPVGDGHPFLLQSSRLPCVRDHIISLQSAPPHAMRRSIWADATQARCADDGDSAPVALFGALIEPI